MREAFARTTGLTAVLLPALLWACGREPGPRAGPASEPAERIVVVSHGQASDVFWSVVANGVADAARDLGLRVEYQAPTSYDMVRMSELIAAAVASKPSGLVLSVPDGTALRGAIQAAQAAGIPVLSINSGAEVWRELGLLTHIGQTEFESALAGGRRLTAAGARRVLCVNHEVGNVSLDERCRGLAAAVREVGGSSSVLAVDLADPEDARQRVAGALAADPALDGILTLGPNGAVPTLTALRETGRLASVRFGTFDLEPSILAAVRDGDLLFAIDQQPWLQGYLGVVSMHAYLTTGTVAGGGDIIRTGPAFVTAENAAAVIGLAERGLR